jgi:hypothetical protein
MKVVGHEMAIAHRHLDGLMAKDRLESSEITCGLEEYTREPMPQIMASVFEAHLLGQPPKVARDLPEAVPITMPEYLRRGRMLRDAQERVISGLA